MEGSQYNEGIRLNDETDQVFTVLEAIIQEERGSLTLDDDIRRYINGFRLHDDVRDKIPLRALGSHLSGLGRDSISPHIISLIKVRANELTHFPDVDTSSADIHIAAPAFCDANSSDTSNGTTLCTKEDILKGIASRPLAFEPWTRPLYSNTGFNLLGWATAQAQQASLGHSSISLEELLDRDVFERIGMNNTSFWVPLDQRNNVAVPRQNVPTMIDWDFTSTFNPYS